ncbi:MAG: hypothetical protein ACUVRZ_05555, partial [Desulfobacca sp.]|uniref:hypothetical protein n=1 Tax=Desulfobacca sp. TaxID=2067990 RepID=UPI00404B9798
TNYQCCSRESDTLGEPVSIVVGSGIANGWQVRPRLATKTGVLATPSKNGRFPAIPSLPCFPAKNALAKAAAADKVKGSIALMIIREGGCSHD